MSKKTTYINTRVVKARSVKDAINSVACERFEESHPLSDEIMTEEKAAITILENLDLDCLQRIVNRLHEKLGLVSEKYKAESIKWNVEDILGQAEKLGIEVSEDRAEKLLHTIISRHDSNEGVTWDTINCYLRDLRD